MALLQGRFEGRMAFAQLLRDALATAAQDGWSSLVLCDADFADWPLGEREVVQSLQAWAGAGRQLTMLAAGYDEVVRRHARFVQWRVQWSHIVQCHACGAAHASALPSLLWSAHWTMRRLDPVHSVGVASFDGVRRMQSRELVDQWMRRSTPSFPPSVLGL